MNRSTFIVQRGDGVLVSPEDARDEIGVAILDDLADHDVLVWKKRPPRGKDPLQLDHVAVVGAGLETDPASIWARELVHAVCMDA